MPGVDASALEEGGLVLLVLYLRVNKRKSHVDTSPLLFEPNPYRVRIGGACRLGVGTFAASRRGR